MKKVSRLRLLISPNSLWPCLVVFSYCLFRSVGSPEADTTYSDLAKQAHYLQAAGWKKVLQSKVFSLSESESLFLSRVCVFPLSVRGFWEFFHFLILFSILFIFFFLFTPGANTPGQSGPGSGGNEGVLHNPSKLQG